MQEDVRADVEIIVVDNGSTELPEAICAAYPNVRLVSEQTPGPGPARNRGIAEAKGDLLAFIDADCRAHANWLSVIERMFEDPGVQVIGGDVQVDYRTPGKPTFLEPYEAIFSYRNHEHIAEGFSGTGNLAMRPEVFAKVGPFSGLSVAEDRDWGFRARDAGFPARYVPEMIAYHPAREGFAELRQKWDRHISHDFAHVTTAGDRAKWAIKTVAMLASPLVAVPVILRSDRISGGWERLLAFLCLVRVRWYRSRRMLAVQLSGEHGKHSASWNRN